MLSVLLHCVAPARECIFLDLVQDLLGRVTREDGRGGVAGRHLAALTLQPGAACMT